MWINRLRNLWSAGPFPVAASPNLAELEQSVCLRNINMDLTRKQKRVLICYISDQFFRAKEELLFHSNRFEACQIIRVFIEMDYAIDVVWPLSDDKQIEKTNYDIVFGFGPVYLRASQSNTDAVKILYLTENNPGVAAGKFRERVEYYYERNKIRKTGIPRNQFYTLSQFEISDYGILKNSSQNAESSKSYFKNSYLIKTTGMRHHAFCIHKEKNMESARKHFLWLGSGGAIHKGLDLLLEVFGELPDVTLHICGLDAAEEDLVADFKSENIINHGFISIDSSEFLDVIVSKCAFVIMPSCSEGISNSVVTGMMHGLIPVVTPECGIEMDYDTGFVLESYKTGYIRDVVIRLSALPSKKLKSMRHNAYVLAQKEFTLDKFTRDFKNIMYKIVSHAELSKNKYCNAKL